MNKLRNIGGGACQACGKPQEPTLNDIVSGFFKIYEGETAEEELLQIFMLALESDYMDSATGKERSDMGFLITNLRDLIHNLEITYLKNS